MTLTGLDGDGDGALSDSEITDRRIYCSGAPGEPGTDGTQGLTALLRTATEPAGAQCAEGGLRIDVGLDDDRDGVLSDAEVEATSYVCDQPDGLAGRSHLIRTSTLAPGCETSGLTLESGLDDDRDGTLDDAEVDVSRVLCATADGATALVRLEPIAAGPTCVGGGVSIVQGVDADGDGTLSPAEIRSTETLCRPLPALVRTATVGPPTCAVSGTRIELGRDADGDGALSGGEIFESTVSCDGAEGASILVRSSSVAPGVDCASGGTLVQSGADTDGDGVLDAGEVTIQTYACDGADGASGRNGTTVRLVTEPAGTNCVLGGVRIETGLDTNGNGQLDATEVTATTYACSARSASSLVEVTTIGSGVECFEGGERVDVGLDTDGDGVLSASEVLRSTYVCSSVSRLPIAITTASVPDAIATSPYSTLIEAVGGLAGGYTWTVASGALPPGLNIDATGTPATTLSGTPTSTGTFTFGLEVTDLVGSTATANYSMTLTAPPCAPGRDGAVAGSFTALTVPSPSISASVRAMAADDSATGWVYWVEPNNSINRFSKDGTQKQEDLQTSLTELATTDIGYEMDIDGDDIYVVSDDTVCTSGCVYRISADGGATYSYQDLASFASAPNDDLRGIAVVGTTMYLVTHDSVETELWSVDLSAATLPVAATRVAVYPDLEYCSGLEADADHLYTVCDDITGASGTGIARISLTTFAAEAWALTPSFFTVGTDIISRVFGQDLNADGRFDILYASGDSGDDLYVCTAAAPGTNPFQGEWLNAFSGDDEGMAFDRTQRRLFKIDESSVNAAYFD